MRITNSRDLDRLLERTGQTGQTPLSPAQKQLKQALADLSSGQRIAAPCPIKKASKAVAVESEGEAYVRIALVGAFGDWYRGGEVVSELIPFTDRNFRCDFALPRYRIYVEVDGWQHHGKSLDDHHSDRERGLYFSARDWLPFRVSHSQAKAITGELVDAITTAMALRDPLERDLITIEPASRSGRWNRLAMLSGIPAQAIPPRKASQC